MKNVWTRSFSGLVFTLIVLAALLINRWVFAAFEVFVLVTMMLEFYKMTMGSHYLYSRSFAILTGVTLFGLIFMVSAWPYQFSDKIVAISLIPLLAVMGGSLYTKDKGEFVLFANLYTGLLYIALPVALSNMLVFHADGSFDGKLMLAFFILIWASDCGAYTFGLLLGRNGRKLFPSISPKKSWAGFWGGMLSAVGVAVGLHWTVLLPYQIIHCVVLAVLMTIAGVYGDLFESQWKRVCEIKDSGSIIPGHGGMMDRFDSSIFAMPVGAIYLILAGVL